VVNNGLRIGRPDFFNRERNERSERAERELVRAGGSFFANLAPFVVNKGSGSEGRIFNRERNERSENSERNLLGLMVLFSSFSFFRG
jgi:hypothetical protein